MSVGQKQRRGARRGPADVVVGSWRVLSSWTRTYPQDSDAVSCLSRVGGPPCLTRATHRAVLAEMFVAAGPTSAALWDVDHTEVAD